MPLEAEPAPAGVEAAAPAATQEVETAASRRRMNTSGRRGDLSDLPEPTMSVEDLAPKVLEAVQTRGVSQTAVCGTLSLSPVYFSIWLKGKAMPETTKKLYTSALELWLDDESFVIHDPALTRTNPSQVPKPKGQRPPPAEKAERAPSSDGGGTARTKAHAARRQERDLLGNPVTPHTLLSELLDHGGEMAFQLHFAPPTLAGAASHSTAALANEAERSLILMYAKLEPTPVKLEASAGVPAITEDGVLRDGTPTAPSDAPAASGSSEAGASEAAEAAAAAGAEGGAPAAVADSHGGGERPRVSKATKAAAHTGMVAFRLPHTTEPFMRLQPNGTLREANDTSVDEGSVEAHTVPGCPLCSVLSTLIEPRTVRAAGRTAALAVTERPQRYRCQARREPTSPGPHVTLMLTTPGPHALLAWQAHPESAGGGKRARPGDRTGGVEAHGRARSQGVQRRRPRRRGHEWQRHGANSEGQPPRRQACAADDALGNGSRREWNPPALGFI